MKYEVRGAALPQKSSSFLDIFKIQTYHTKIQSMMISNILLKLKISPTQRFIRIWSIIFLAISSCFQSQIFKYIKVKLYKYNLIKSQIIILCSSAKFLMKLCSNLSLSFNKGSSFEDDIIVRSPSWIKSFVIYIACERESSLFTEGKLIQTLFWVLWSNFITLPIDNIISILTLVINWSLLFTSWFEVSNTLLLLLSNAI